MAVAYNVQNKCSHNAEGHHRIDNELLSPHTTSMKKLCFSLLVMLLHGTNKRSGRRRSLSSMTQPLFLNYTEIRELAPFSSNRCWLPSRFSLYSSVLREACCYRLKFSISPFSPSSCRLIGRGGIDLRLTFLCNSYKKWSLCTKRILHVGLLFLKAQHTRLNCILLEGYRNDSWKTKISCLDATTNRFKSSRVLRGHYAIVTQ